MKLKATGGHAEDHKDLGIHGRPREGSGCHERPRGHERQRKATGGHGWPLEESTSPKVENQTPERPKLDFGIYYGTHFASCYRSKSL